MLTVLRSRLRPNCTAPGASANSVSSLPRPTLSPGWKCVPRWRTMISPALTTWPPKRLTPRCCALESRPLRVELAPFLCAMCCSSADRGDAHAGQVLAVTLALLVAGLVLELLDDDLRAALVVHERRRDRDLGQVGGRVRHGVAVHEQHGREGQRAVLGRLLTVDDEDGSDLDLFLAPTGAHNRIDHFEP